jgi:hypothetical protein
MLVPFLMFFWLAVGSICSGFQTLFWDGAPGKEVTVIQEKKTKTLPRHSGQWAPLPSELSGTC